MVRRRTLVLLLGIAAVLALASFAASMYIGFGGKSGRLLIYVHVPSLRVKADWCAVAAYRFPTLHNPTKSGGLEEIGAVKTKPGSTISLVLRYNAVPVKIEPTDNGGSKVIYYDPQEVLIRMVCYKKIGSREAQLVAEYHRIVEIKPSHKVDSIYISINPKNISYTVPGVKAKTQVTISKQRPGPAPTRLSSGQNQCEIYFNSNTGFYECHAETALAKLYAAPGIKLYFGGYSVPRRSAEYLSSFTKECKKYDFFTCECEEWETSWKESGKKLTPFQRGASPGNELEFSIGPVEGGWSAYALGDVRYRLEYIHGDSDNVVGECYTGPYLELYPFLVDHLVGVKYLSPYNPEYVPPYAGKSSAGGEIIGFWPYGNTHHKLDYGSKTTIASSITFCGSVIGVNGCFSLNIAVYQAARNDNDYTVPFAILLNPNRIWYYDWFADDNPLSYTVYTYTSS